MERKKGKGHKGVDILVGYVCGDNCPEIMCSQCRDEPDVGRCPRKKTRSMMSLVKYCQIKDLKCDHIRKVILQYLDLTVMINQETHLIAEDSPVFNTRLKPNEVSKLVLFVQRILFTAKNHDGTTFQTAKYLVSQVTYRRAEYLLAKARHIPDAEAIVITDKGFSSINSLNSLFPLLPLESLSADQESD